MVLKIGRVGLDVVLGHPSEMSEERTIDGGRALVLRGWLMSTSQTNTKALRSELIDQIGQLVAVTYTLDSQLDGFYIPTDIRIDAVLSSFRSSGAYRFEASLIRLGTDSRTELQSLITGAGVVNDHARAGKMWWAAPSGALAISTGATTVIEHQRSSEDGELGVFINVSTDDDPTWSISPINYYRSAVKVYVGGNLRSGQDVRNDPANWSLENGIVRIRPVTFGGSSTGRITINYHNGTAWGTEIPFKVRWANTTDIPAWHYMTIVRNSPELSIVRIVRDAATAPPSAERHVLDFQLRRGAPFVSCYYCVDEETELLSRRGWLRHNEAKEGDFIWTLKDGRGEWAEVEEVFAAPYEGPMIRMTGRSMSALVTPNHRWLVHRNGRWYWRETTELAGDDRLPLTADPVEASPIYSDAFVELLGWVVTDGTYPKDGSVVIYQSEKANSTKCRRIEACLSLLGEYKLSRGSNGINRYRIVGEIAAAVRAVAPMKYLEIPWLADLTPAQRRLLLEVVILGDGTIAATRGGKYQHRSIGTASEMEAAGYQALVALAGLTSRRHKRTLDSDFNGYQFTVEMNYVQVKNSRNTKPGNLTFKEVPYEGIVWCPRTANGTFLARRDGHTYFTGNTYTGAAATHAVARDAADASTLTVAGIHDNDLIGGHKWVLGTPKAFAHDAPNAKITLTAAAQTFPFFIGGAIDNAANGSNDGPADVCDQYVGWVSETVRAIRR